jgi:hypothetical protein
MKTALLFTIALVSLAAIASPKKATPPPPAPTAEETAAKARDKLIADAQTLITDRLKDPESARFRAVFTSPKMLAVCGEVNAKNSMGGYVGFRRFIVAQDKAGTEEDGSYFVESNWDGRCKNDVIY